MDGLTIAECAKLLLPIAKKVWPHARRVYQEHQAGIMPVVKGSDLLSQEFQDTLNRITGGNVDDTWWQNLLNAIEQPLVLPDFLRIPAVQEWLSDDVVQTQLKTIARSCVMGSKSGDRKFPATLRSKYSEKTGEHERFSNLPITVVVSILVAGFLSSIPKTSRPIAAMLQASADESRAGIEGLHERFDRIGADSIVVKAHNEEVAQNLFLIIKKRSIDPSTARQEIRNLVKRVLDGDLHHADIVNQGYVLYWATRIHAGDVITLTDAKEYRGQLLGLKPDADTRILDALILDTEGDADGALRILRDIDNPDGRAALLVVLRKQSSDVALEWFDKQPGRDDPHFLTGTGWANVALTLAETGRWEEAAAYLFKARVHIDDWPDLSYLEGVIIVALMLPEEHRRSVLTMNVFHPIIHTLEGSQIDILRQRANERFALAEQKMIAIGLEGRARGARMWCLWLRLTDRRPKLAEEARREVQEGLKDGTTVIDFLPFAQTFNIPFDPDPIKNYLAQQKRLGGLNEAETFAEFQLAEQIMTDKEFASFLEKEETRFINALSQPGLKAMLSGKRIEALVDDGQTARARHLLEERKGEFEGRDYERLQAMIITREGADPRDNLEDIYRQTHDLIDLRNLINCIGRAGDWRALKPLLEEIFRRERTAKNAHQLVECMRRLPDADDNIIAEFLKKNEDLFPQNSDLACEMAWALFRLGRWQESRKINDDLLKNRHAHVDIALDINLAIMLGESERFAAIIDREWQSRQEREPHLLMLLATIAAEVDQTERRSFEFAEIAASKAPDDPKVLVNAYALAVQLGREDDVKVGEWMSRAVALSDRKGPVWKADMREVAEMIPAHRERSRRSEEAFLRGDIPVHLAADALNIPLSRILLDIPQNNELMDDYRRLVVLPILSGARLPVEVRSEWVIGLDATSIMILWYLDLLPLTFDSFPTLVIAPDMMPLLLNERRRVRFHQPSRVKSAEEIQRLNLRPMNPPPKPPSWLVDEVGLDLAQLLQTAQMTNGYVVHPLPIHTLSIYTIKEADLREYGNLIISTQAFSRMLFDNGSITEQQYKRSLEYLHLHDRDRAQMPDSSRLQRPLYLDDLAVSYLQSSGILQAACSCGINIQVHQAFPSEQAALIKAEREGRDLADSLDKIRVSLQHAFESGKAVFLPRRQADNDEPEKHETSYHITTNEQFLIQVGPCDAICIDDRFFNKHPIITDQCGQSAPIICTLDLLRHFEKRGLITEEEKNEKLHKLRKAGFFFVPIEPAELERLLRKVDLDQNMQVKETAELRVLRRTLMRIRSLDIIQQPLETPFLDRLRLCCVMVIFRLWRDQNLSPTHLVALTDWLWSNVSPSPLDWIRTARGKDGMKPEAEAYAIHVELLLRFMPSIQGERLEAFRNWAERTVLEPLLPANADLVDAITLRIRAGIEELCKEHGKNA